MFFSDFGSMNSSDVVVETVIQGNSGMGRQLPIRGARYMEPASGRGQNSGTVSIESRPTVFVPKEDLSSSSLLPI
jgi:hypothetical protein